MLGRLRYRECRAVNGSLDLTDPITYIFAIAWARGAGPGGVRQGKCGRNRPRFLGLVRFLAANGVKSEPRTRSPSC